MRRLTLVGAAAAFSLAALIARAFVRSRRSSVLFIGTQGQGEGQGVHAARLDEATGRLTPLGLAAELERPTWVLADPRRSCLYAVSEVGNDGRSRGDVASYRIGRRDGRLDLLGSVDSGGGGPTHLALDPKGRALFVANFGDGVASVIPVAPDGVLEAVASTHAGTGSGPHRRQQGPHAHGVTLDPSGRFLLVPDMGADRVFIYAFNEATLGLSPARRACLQLPAGSGPRLLIFGRDGRFAYLLTELSAELVVLGWESESGSLTLLATVALDGSIEPQSRSAAALAINARGDRLYVSNRAAEAICVFAVDTRSGQVERRRAVAAGGSKPWSAEISPSGRWLLVTNQGSGVVRVFEIDRRTGDLAPTESSLSIPSPTSVAFARPAARPMWRGLRR